MLLVASTANTLQAQTVNAKSAPVPVQLDFPLSQQTIAQLRAEGIDLMHHYGKGIYLTSSLPSNMEALDVADLRQHNASVLNGYSKVDQEKANSRVDVDLVYAFENAPKFLTEVLAKADFIADKRQIENGRTLSGNLKVDALDELLAHPYLLDATPSLGELVPYNLEARIAQSVTPLNSGIAGAPGLNGHGIVLGVGDGGKLAGHPDLGERILHTTEQYNAGWGNHPDMVSGIIGGAGNVFASNRGVASEAELIIESSSAIVYHAPTYLDQYGMTITNNSYGPSFNCNTANSYFGNSASADQQLYDNPSLLHVFAVGNSGTRNCASSPEGYSNIPGGPQNAKNTLSVGNVKFNRERNPNSSTGPTRDGRLKPEISAVGSSVMSTLRNRGYGTGTGTSYAAPNVAATLALLSEAYQRKHPGITPEGALLKAIACNTADDAGPIGPDYEYGFGILNGHNALQAVEAMQYEVDNITSEEEIYKSISVAEGTSELKVMLYWNDLAGSTSSEGAVLVNDLDLLLISPDGTETYPLVLDPTDPSKAATASEDHVNNIEQVTIRNPQAGDYRIVISASNLSYGIGNFVLTWFAPQPSVVMTCPFGGEALIPSQSTYVAWTATSGDQGEWTIEYTVDGENWELIQDDIPGATRSISWAPPSDVSQAELRIRNTVLGIEDVTNAPVVMVSPPGSLSAQEICATSLTFSWKPVSTASTYGVYRFDGEQMQRVGTAVDTSWTFEGLNAGEQLLLSVCSITEANQTSKRAYAFEVTHVGQEEPCLITPNVTWGELSTSEVDSNVYVAWEVSEERRVLRFELERRLGPVDRFEWTYVDSVKAKGTVNSSLTYGLFDEQAAPQGITYYRVKMVGDDGQSSYSNEFEHDRSVISGTENSGITTTNTFELIQNPVGETILLNALLPEPQTVILYDLIGRERASFILQSGVNHIPWPMDLSAGMYFIRSADVHAGEVIKLVHR